MRHIRGILHNYPHLILIPFVRTVEDSVFSGLVFIPKQLMRDDISVIDVNKVVHFEIVTLPVGESVVAECFGPRKWWGDAYAKLHEHIKFDSTIANTRNLVVLCSAVSNVSSNSRFKPRCAHHC